MQGDASPTTGGPLRTFASLDSVDADIRKRFVDGLATAAQVDVLGTSALFPLEELPLFEPKLTVAAVEGQVAVRVLSGSPDGAGEDRAVMEGSRPGEF
ncbi:MAG: hypothetical protein GY724_17005 [Actinomycetia bacterium]|nr:hypothetical protein [Actinomycetes bacterium]